LRNNRKLGMILVLFSMALLLSVFPYIDASASRFEYERAAEGTEPAFALPVTPLARDSLAVPGSLTPLPLADRPMKLQPAPPSTVPAPAPVPAAVPDARSLCGLDCPAVAAPPKPIAPEPVSYQQYVTTAYYLNVRKGAGTDSQIVRVVEMGELLNVRGKTDNGWLELDDGSFVHSAYAQLVHRDEGKSAASTKTLAPPALDASTPAKPSSSVHSDSGLTLEHIGVIMQDTALDEPSLASAVLEIEDEYGINAFFTIAVMKLESGNGKSKLAKMKNNLFGLNATGGSNSQAYAFDTKADSVRKFGKLIADAYVDEGYTTVEKVGGKYCPANDKWPALVKKIMNSDHRKLVDSPVI